jgi:hypothetical protein
VTGPLFNAHTLLHLFISYLSLGRHGGVWSMTLSALPPSPNAPHPPPPPLSLQILAPPATLRRPQEDHGGGESGKRHGADKPPLRRCPPTTPGTSLSLPTALSSLPFPSRPTPTLPPNTHRETWWREEHEYLDTRSWVKKLHIFLPSIRYALTFIGILAALSKQPLHEGTAFLRELRTFAAVAGGVLAAVMLLVQVNAIPPPPSLFLRPPL